jgi:starvation-inducible DNA-binding protein
MEQLLLQLRTLLADNVALGMKAHGYHWNVESDDFEQLHAFFGKIYDNFDGATDTYAEWLRMLKAYSPYRLTDFFDLSTVGENVLLGDPDPMIVDLYNEIEAHIAKLIEAGKLANALNEFGLANFLADRQTASQKFCWMLRASIEMEMD